MNEGSYIRSWRIVFLGLLIGFRQVFVPGGLASAPLFADYPYAASLAAMFIATAVGILCRKRLPLRGLSLPNASGGIRVRAFMIPWLAIAMAASALLLRDDGSLGLFMFLLSQAGFELADASRRGAKSSAF
ncbi:MAG: hypothetical protein WC712_09695, partial [Candidatus Brocadiia bacterium]